MTPFTTIKRLIAAQDFLLLIALLVSTIASAQTEIPLESWRMHFSYNAINSVTVSTDKIFAASQNGILIFEKTENNLTSYSKLNGLSATGISYINYDDTTKKLLVGYDDGNIDILNNNIVTNFNRLKNSVTINGSRKINHITMRAGYAYLATDYGLVVFDLKNVDVKETWRDLGSDGSRLKIYQSTFKGDSVFLATEKGILGGDVNTNLLDYHNWKRFNKNALNGPVQFITALNNELYSAINNSGIYHYSNGQWVLESILQGHTFSSLNASATNLWITGDNSVWRFNTLSGLSSITDAVIVQPRFAIEDTSAKIWIGDGKSGLVSNMTGNFSGYIPNGPVNTSSLRLKYFNNSIYNLPGGYSSAFQPLGNSSGYDVFHNGQWENKPTASKDITDASIASNVSFFASFGDGVEKRNETELVTIYDENNSTLINTNPPGKFINITAIENSTDGLWVTNYGATSSLHLLGKNNEWQSFSFSNIPGARYLTDLLVDSNGFVWAIINPTQGGGILVFDKTGNRTKQITDQPGTGALPSKSVRSVTLDRDGAVWIGTDAGVAYFSSTYSIFTSTADAIKPIVENRYLLRNEIVTCIKADGANRKWIGTVKGVWLFNATGEQPVYNFTEENSPLISNKIQDIEINAATGEVFFATDKGIISYRGNATEGNTTFQTVKIFPNPVTKDFNGQVGISGLATDAVVKITDVSGKLVWQTTANGGTASWNVQDYNGRRATTGVYVVFVATQDGAESVVGKIAIID